MHTPFADTDIENFDRIQTVNARGMFLCCRAEAAAMRKQTPRTFTSRTGTRDIGRGAIVNVCSANSFAGLIGKGSYTVSKHACMAVTKMVGKLYCLALSALRFLQSILGYGLVSPATY